jgi:hypothetical protein
MIRVIGCLIIGITILSLVLAGCESAALEDEPTGTAIPQPTATPGLELKIEQLLSQYGWTSKQIMAVHMVILPDSFQHAPGDFPYAIYWAYNNILNHATGLDLAPYLGQTVQASIYILNEPLPEVFFRYEEARAVIITDENKIIGAWIEKAAGFACSLDRQVIGDLESQAWREWLVTSGVVDLTNALDVELAAKTPEEIITLYYTALNAHDQMMVNALRSRRSLAYDLFSNKDAQSLYNLPDQASYMFWIDNTESATVLSIRELDPAPGNCLPVYEARVDFQFYDTHRPTIPEGENLRFIVLNQEIERLGWRIEEINTAPGVSQRLCEP